MNDQDGIGPKRAAVVGGFALALMAGAFFGALTTSFVEIGNAEPPRAVEPAKGADLGGEGLTFAPAVEAALPAVVNIATAKSAPSASELSPFFNDPFFRDFFGHRFPEPFRAPRPRREESLGSGVIVREDGYILTNNHVVEGAEEIEVALIDKRTFSATVVGTDPRTDLAVLQVEADALPTVELGESGSVEVGDLALAIGNPFGVGQTVTMGIVSAVGRGNLGIVDYEDFIQTDASINPGNSGGALVDTQGRLIGINTAIIARGAQGNQGIGFAIPIDMARAVMDQILDTGRVVRGWLGVSIQEITPELAKAFELDARDGALVAEVVPDSPAAAAGLEAGDVIVEVDGEPVEDVRELRLRIAGTPPETRIALTVVRRGERVELDATLGELPEELSREPLGAGDDDGALLSDIEVRDLDPEVRRQLRIAPDVEGVLVTAVAPGGPADDAGLMRGDVIVAINRELVGSVARFRELAAQVRGESVLLRVHRRGSSLFLVVERE